MGCGFHERCGRCAAYSRARAIALNEEVEGKSLLRARSYERNDRAKSEYKRTPPREHTSRDMGQMAPSLKRLSLDARKSAFRGLTHARKHASRTLNFVHSPALTLIRLNYCAVAAPSTVVFSSQIHNYTNSTGNTLMRPRSRQIQQKLRTTP